MKKFKIENRIVSNSMWMIAERILQMCISLVVNAMVNRYLGPDNNGLITYCASYVNMCTAFATLGLEYIVIKELVSNPEAEGKIIGTSLVMRIVSSIACIVAIQGVVAVSRDFQAVYMTVTLLQSVSLVFKSAELIDFWFQSKLNSKQVAIAKGITYFAVAGWRIFGLATARSVEYFAFATTLDALLVALILLYMYQKAGGGSLSFDIHWVKRLLSQSCHFILASMITVLYSEMDKLMLGNMLGDYDVGIYNGAYGVAMMWVFVPNAIMNSYRPAIVEGYTTKINYLERVRTLYSIMIWLGIFVGIGMMLFSRPLIWLLCGPAYAGSAACLCILIWSTLFSHLSVARNTWMVCENLQRYSEIFPIWGVATNFVLNYLLIPRMGAMGASVATLMTQVVVTLIAPLFYKRVRPSVKHMTDAFFARDLRDRLKGVIGKRDENRA